MLTYKHAANSPNQVLTVLHAVVMTCLVDCCHSGTILDLPFTFKQDGAQQQIEFDEDYKFPHGGKPKSKKWHWSVYALAVVPLAIAIAIPIALVMLPSGVPSEPEPVPEPERRGPLRLLGKVFSRK